MKALTIEQHDAVVRRYAFLKLVEMPVFSGRSDVRDTIKQWRTITPINGGSVWFWRHGVDLLEECIADVLKEDETA